MKSLIHADQPAAPIVALAGDTTAPTQPLADGHGSETGLSALARARAFAEPLLADRVLDTGEEAFAHASGVAEVLKSIGGAPSLQAASWAWVGVAGPGPIGRTSPAA